MTSTNNTVASLPAKLIELADFAEQTDNGDLVPGGGDEVRCVFLNMRPEEFDSLIREAATALASPAPSAPDLDAMVSRFLAWRLPEDFGPDAGVSFVPPLHPHGWPTGTNLLTAVQARAMFEHCMASASSGVDLCEVARELERVHAEKVITDVAAIAGDRTDAYWSGHSQACEEIAHRLGLAPAALSGVSVPPSVSPAGGGGLRELVNLLRQREPDNGEDHTDHDKGYEQASAEIADMLEKILATPEQPGSAVQGEVGGYAFEHMHVTQYADPARGIEGKVEWRPDASVDYPSVLLKNGWARNIRPLYTTPPPAPAADPLGEFIAAQKPLPPDIAKFQSENLHHLLDDAPAAEQGDSLRMPFAEWARIVREWPADESPYASGYRDALTEVAKFLGAPAAAPTEDTEQAEEASCGCSLDYRGHHITRCPNDRMTFGLYDSAAAFNYPQAQPEARGVEGMVPKLHGNWPEDASHENGDYECKCITCGATFYGHKRRVVCKVCAAPNPEPVRAEQPEVQVGDALAQLAYKTWRDTPISPFPNDSHFPKWRAVVSAIIAAAAPAAPGAAVDAATLTRWRSLIDSAPSEVQAEITAVLEKNGAAVGVDFHTRFQRAANVICASYKRETGLQMLLSVAEQLSYDALKAVDALAGKEGA